MIPLFQFNFLVPKMRGEPLEFNVLQFFKLDLVLFAEVNGRFEITAEIFNEQYYSLQLLTTIPAYMIIYSQFLE